MLKIAVIDDGVNEGLYNADLLQHNIEITPELEIRHRTGYDPFLPSHGTTCAAIIKKYASDAVLSSIKILNDSSKKGMKGQLVKALEWCAANGIGLANLSLGTIDYRDFEELSVVVKNVGKQGLVIVAACNNRNVYTCPASLPDVIGVKCDISGNLGEGEYTYNSSAPDGIEITGCGGHYIANYSGKSRTTSLCNSFTAPMITAIVHGIIKMNQGITLAGIKEKLKTMAVVKKVRTNNPVSERVNISGIDVPIIAILADSADRAANVAQMFAGLFREDGYNAVTAVYNESLEMLYTVYDPDVILLSTDDPKEVQELEGHTGLDMVLIYGCGNADDIKQSLETGNSTRIIIFLWDNMVDEIYRSIIEMFKING